MGKTEYSGVTYREVKRLDGKGTERMYYIRYQRDGRLGKDIKEPVGRASQGWTPGKANRERALRMNGDKPSNKERREAQKREKLIGQGPLNIGRLWEIYLASHESNRSIRDDINRYQKHIAPYLAKTLIDDLQTADIERLRKKLEKYGLSPQSVKHCLGLVKRLIRYGVQLGLFPMPLIYFAMPKVDNLKTENMSADQLAAYWQAMDEEADQNSVAILRLALVTGIRKSALFALQWKDCDFENSLIRLAGESAKNGKTDFIPMNDAARAILKKVARISPYVFPGMDGRRKDFSKIARRVREKAGLPKTFRPLHGLRHVFASTLASSGKVDLYSLQKLMTHGSFAMTQRYAKLTDEALKKSASVANQLAGIE